MCCRAISASCSSWRILVLSELMESPSVFIIDDKIVASYGSGTRLECNRASIVKTLTLVGLLIFKHDFRTSLCRYEKRIHTQYAMVSTLLGISRVRNFRRCCVPALSSGLIYGFTKA